MSGVKYKRTTTIDNSPSTDPSNSPKAGSGKFWKGWDGTQKYNVILFIIHLILVFVFIFYFKSLKNPNRPPDYVNLDLFDHKLSIKPNSMFEYLSVKIASLTESNVTTMIVIFFAITAGFHLLYALNPRGIYSNAIKNGNNFMRWIEYSITATIMIVIISLLSGVKDFRSYIILITSTIAMMYTGQMFETSSGASRWIPILVGFILLIGVWSVITSSFNSAIDSVKEFSEKTDSTRKIPSWLYAIVYVLLFFYALFGLVPVAQIAIGGKYKRYEYSYLTLSLIAKVTLGVLVAVGFGQRLKADQQS